MIDEEKVSQVKDEWRLYQAEDDHKVLKKPNQRVDNHWREVFKIKTTSGETKYNQFQKVVKSVLSLQNANAAVESSLSDNGNTLMKEWIGLLPENLIGLRRMKEYARHKGEFHCIVFTQNMLEGMKKAKRKNDGGILKEHKAEEEVRQELKEDVAKKKEQEAMLKNAAKSRKI